jgi:hypothetical protein
VPARQETQQGATTRAQRDAARERRAEAARRGAEQPSRAARRDDRPPAPWGSFPLSELVVLAGIAMMVVGLLSGGGDDSRRWLGMGVAVASLGGLEFAVRDHFAGHRSHTTLLAGAGAAATMLIVTLALEPPLWLPLTLGVLVFAAAWRPLREVFRRRSGGLSFR